MISLDYKAAVRRLPLGPCRICSCGGDRVPFLFLSVDSAVRYACPACEATSWHVDDRGRHHGFLRSHVEPAWSWVPFEQRAAIARYGVLGATPTERGGAPILRVEAVDGAVWVADRAIAVRLDREATLLEPTAAQVELCLCRVERSGSIIARALAGGGYRSLDIAEDLVPVQAVALVTALYPLAAWSWRDEQSAVLAFVETMPVAAVMPLAPARRAAA